MYLGRCWTSSSLHNCAELQATVDRDREEGPVIHDPHDLQDEQVLTLPHSLVAGLSNLNLKFYQVYYHLPEATGCPGMDITGAVCPSKMLWTAF